MERFSDEDLISGPLDQLETARQANAVLRRMASWPPARTRSDGVAGERHRQDEHPAGELGGARRGGRAAAEQPVPAAEGRPAVSRRAAVGPVRYEASRLVPRLTARVSRAATPNVSLFARLYPRAGGEDPVLTLDFARDGKVVARSQPAMPAPDRSGRLAYVGGVSVAAFPPGACEDRLTLAQGAETASASTRVELVA